MLEIRQPRKSDSPKAFLDIINELIEEDTFLQNDKLLTLKQEKAWLDGQLAAIKKGKTILLNAWDGKRIIGSCGANREEGKQRQNVSIGLMVRKEFRGRGLGEMLLRRAISLARKKLKPKNIFLSVTEGNTPAMGLYKKIGFREVARLPEWRLHRGKYHDVVYMLLKRQKKKNKF